MTARWLWLRVAGALALMLMPAWGFAASVLFVTTGPVTPGKFKVLAEVAAPYGVKVDARFVEQMGAVDARLWAGYDMVFFDAPRDHMQEVVEAKLQDILPALAQAKTPVMWLHTERPQWQNLPTELAKRLHAYYIHGGRANNKGFFASVAATVDKKSFKSIAPPQSFPTTAIYHPKAPALVFADTAAYFRWRGQPRTKPVIAVAFHQQSIAAEQTGLIDGLIARIEAAGAVPLAFYSPVMDNTGNLRVLAPEGKPLAQVLITAQIMLNPEGRRTDFEKLGIPVIQAMAYRKGGADAWRADTSGIALMDVPFYLAQPEFAGVHDIMVAAATDSKDQLQAIPEQADAVVRKALKLARLAQMDNADKKVAIMFWNYPAGEKNLSASFMNLPQSLHTTLVAMQAEGYRTETPDAATLTRQLQRLLTPYYRPGSVELEMEALVKDGLAELMPLASYQAWLTSLPQDVRDGWTRVVPHVERSVFLVQRKGEKFFAVPRLKLGNVTVMPQPPRTEPVVGGLYVKDKEIYHSATAAPPHSYMANYLWVRHQFKADALIHFGTHGTQEWLPGKERGLSVSDYPLMALGDVPVIYPYIVDNIGEATQTKRRGRAVNISHQTPPFAPAGLHAVLTRLHDDLHAWLAQDQGAVKEQLRLSITAQVRKERIDRDMAWTSERMEREFPLFISALHDHLHELAQTAQPLGLHTFGQGADVQGRLYTVLMMLGAPFWEATATYVDGHGQEADEAIIADYARMTQTAPYQLLHQHVVLGNSLDALPPMLQTQLEQARRWYADLGAEGETRGLLAALSGRYIPTSYGGDPIKNPDSLPTGRNLYGFDPSRIPTQAAWNAGKEALDKLVAAHRQKTGKQPAKFTFSLWSVETMRHMGMLEAQALWALGVEPVWDAGGRVIDVRRVPRQALGRPRIDVVLSATGLYRDHFPNVMKQLARAAQLAAQATDEVDNPVAHNTAAIARQLGAQGWRNDAALKAAQTRIFSGAAGSYGSGLDDAAVATDTWDGKDEGDRKMAELYLRKMQYAYGPDEADWGKSGAELAKVAGVDGAAAYRSNNRFNLYAAQLKGTEAAVLSRSSNLYGMLTTDDPFQYLGGISTAVRYLDGKAPELFISNLRGAGSGKAEEASAFLARELATREFHPGYIQGLMKEGYAGTLQMLDSMNNFTGWTTVAREIVRDDQWQEFADVYVRDKHNLGLRQYMEQNNPHALAQMMERMLEMARQGYWQADAATVNELKDRYKDLAQRFDVRTSNETFQSFVGLTGYGLGRPVDGALATASSAPHLAATAPARQPPTLQEQLEKLEEMLTPPQIKGMQLEKIMEQPVVQALGAMLMLAMGLLLVAPALGAWRQWRTA